MRYSIDKDVIFPPSRHPFFPPIFFGHTCSLSPITSSTVLAAVFSRLTSTFRLVQATLLDPFETSFQEELRASVCRQL